MLRITAKVIALQKSIAVSSVLDVDNKDKRSDVLSDGVLLVDVVDDCGDLHGVGDALDVVDG